MKYGGWGTAWALASWRQAFATAEVVAIQMYIVVRCSGRSGPISPCCEFTVVYLVDHLVSPNAAVLRNVFRTGTISDAESTTIE